jgi:hypothetical protein
MVRRREEKMGGNFDTEEVSPRQFKYMQTGCKLETVRK